jgi:hypothetical protein
LAGSARITIVIVATVKAEDVRIVSANAARGYEGMALGPKATAVLRGHNRASPRAADAPWRS